MAIGSIIIGVIAFLFMVAGFFLSPVPYVGAVLSFGSPVLGLVGIVMAGVSMSRAKQTGETSGAATAGLVVNIIAFILGLAVALTCGLCNACMTSNMNNPRNRGQGFGSSLGGELGAELSRVNLAMTLAGLNLSCAGDPSGANAGQYFHPQAFPALQAQACSLTQNAADAYSQACSPGVQPCSTVASLTGTPDASRATALSLQADDCYLYTSGQGKLIGCETPQGFKIIHWENVNAVQ